MGLRQSISLILLASVECKEKCSLETVKNRPWFILTSRLDCLCLLPLSCLQQRFHLSKHNGAWVFMQFPWKWHQWEDWDQVFSLTSEAWISTPPFIISVTMNHLTTPGLSYHICKIWVIIATYQGALMRIKGINSHKALKAGMPLISVWYVLAFLLPELQKTSKAEGRNGWSAWMLGTQQSPAPGYIL